MEIYTDRTSDAAHGHKIWEWDVTNYRIHGATGEWEAVIGLQVHAQIANQFKSAKRA